MRRQNGTVSIIALWLLAILSLAVVGAAVAARSELKAVSWNEWSALRRGAASYALAEAQHLLLEDDPEVDGLSDRWAKVDEDGWRSAPAPEGWVNRMRISDLERKLNINRCDDRMLIRLGGLSAGEVDTLIEARQRMALRMKDLGKTVGFLSPDDIPRVLLGAAWAGEIEEDVPPALRDPSCTFTVRGDGKINVNTASPKVMAAVLGIPKRVILGIVRERAGPDGVDGSEDDTPVERMEDLREVFGVTRSDYDKLRRRVVLRSYLFRIDIRTAHANRKNVTGRLTVTVKRHDGALRILEWQEW